MRRIVVLGAGGVGKSTLSRRLGQGLGLPVVELDELFWKPDLAPTRPDEWAVVQQNLVEAERWVLDGDLGPYDLRLDVRLAAADAVIVLDFPRWRCVWQTLRRGRERLDYWRWMLTWRSAYRPTLMETIALHAPAARVHVLRSPRAVEHFVSEWVPVRAAG